MDSIQNISIRYNTFRSHLWGFTLILWLLPQSIYPVDALYSYGTPVQFTSKLSMDIHESLPVLNLSTQAKQILKFDLTLASGQTFNIPSASTQSALKVILRDVFVNLNVNQEDLTIDPKTIKSAIPLMQLKGLINQPIQLAVDAQGKLLNEQNQIDWLLKEFPGLKNVQLEQFFNELFQPLFIPYGKALQVDDTFNISVKNRLLGHPAELTYKIIRITDQEAVAVVSGQINPDSLFYDIDQEGGGGKNKQVEMTFSSILKGEIAWNLRNAMLFKVETECNFNAQLKSQDMEWTMHGIIHHESSTSR